MENQTPIYRNTKLWLLTSFTLGLAPYFPEPHFWGKLKWIVNGGAVYGEKPMQLIDWFDLFLHGTPWLMLIISLLVKIKFNKKY